MKPFLEKIKIFKGIFRKKKPRIDGKLPVKVVFSRFRQVLDGNNRALEIMADMGDKLSGDYIFDINYIKSSCSELADTIFKSIYNLNTLAQNRYLYLHGAFERINAQISRIIQGKPPSSLKEPVLFYKDISWDMVDEVGGKNANLAELRNYLRLNVPDGFAITTSAFTRFVEYNSIEEKINKLKQKYREAAKRSQQEDVMTAITFAEAGEQTTAQEILREEDYLNESFLLDVQKLFRTGTVPPELDGLIEKGLVMLKDKYGEKCFVAVRSSAEEEDREFSFAGQFETVLNVPAEKRKVEEAYKEVLASLYSPKAIAYKEQVMPKDKHMSMSVGCITMVYSEVSGVMYSSDPNDLNNDVVIINANWGLGKTVVDGSVDADHYIVGKEEPYPILNKKAGGKDFIIVAGKNGGIEKVPLPEERREKECLNDEQLKELARQAILIEHYFKKPQDIEWAIDKNGKIFILQSRALRISPELSGTLKDISSALQKYPVIMDGKGMIAQRGIGAGRVFILNHMEELKDFIPGSVLVAKHDSSQFIKVMPRASAIITNIGTPTSHMANIAREFQVPTIVNTGIGTEVLKHGDEITVDADDNRIYAGIIKELLRYKIAEDVSLKGLSEFRLLKKILKYITPLNLIDPLFDNFTPEGCQTFHDIIRFIHEKAIAELVDVERYERDLLKDNIAVKLDVPIPAGIFIIDIGGGLNLKEGSNKATIDEISSIPFKSIVKGMLHPGVWRSDSVPLKMDDFMSSMLKMPDISSMRYLGENVAVISREYVNLTLRFGYHFNMMDCYCSENIRDNHIYFRFVGGATDIAKRSRRAELLAQILKEYDLIVNVKGDLVIARTGNINRSEMEGILDRLGRLIAYSRQLDALMDDDQSVQYYVKKFLKESYHSD